MKNKIRILFALALVFSGGNSFAQTNKNIPGPTDYARFSGFVTERNIFDPNRVPHYSSGGPRKVVHSHARNTAVPTIALVGTMAYAKGDFAFFSSNDAEQQKVLPVAAKIADYTVAEIRPDGVTLADKDNKKLAMKLGDVLRQESGSWQLAGPGDVPTGAASSAGSSDAGPSAPVAPAAASEPNDILRRLMEKRAKGE